MPDNDAVAALWQRFQSRHPKLADQDELVGEAAKEIFGNAVALGADVDTILADHGDTLIDQVAEAAYDKASRQGLNLTQHAQIFEDTRRAIAEGR